MLLRTEPSPGPRAAALARPSSARERSLIPKSLPIALPIPCGPSFGCGSSLCSDGWPGYDGLVDVGYDKYVRINRQKSFANGRAHINSVEACWSFTERRLPCSTVSKSTLIFSNANFRYPPEESPYIPSESTGGVRGETMGTANAFSARNCPKKSRREA
jgi:hypothetical protein